MKQYFFLQKDYARQFSLRDETGKTILVTTSGPLKLKQAWLTGTAA
jgi:hypothetical protein